MRISLSLLVAMAASLMGLTSADASRTQQSGHTSWIMEAMQGSAQGLAEAPRTSRRGSRSERNAESRSERGSTGRSESSSGVGPRPSQWCGWWMRTQRGGGPEFNLAWNWTRYGSPGSPQVGAVVVWRHHVGEIVGQASNGQWIVRSGNDGGQVRSRARSISGAVIRV